MRPLLNRRQLLAAFGFLPFTAHAMQEQTARFLSSALRRDGLNVAILYDTRRGALFETPLPGRGHGPCLSSDKKIAVMPARRPGRWAMVIDMTTGKTITRLSSPKGRHFYGHAVFSPDDRLLLTTENDYDHADGMIGVWDTKSWQRLDEWPSGGIGPHELALCDPVVVVANGGLLTHPETGRDKRNLATMRPNLCYLSLKSGKILQQVEPPAKWFQCSLRHLDITRDETGQIFTLVGAQYQGPKHETAPLVALHSFGAPLDFVALPPELLRNLHHYCGSVRFIRNGRAFAITSPRGNSVLFGSGTEWDSMTAQDACGLGGSGNSVVLTTGTGDILSGNTENGLEPWSLRKNRTRFQWDNHLIQV